MVLVGQLHSKLNKSCYLRHEAWAKSIDSIKMIMDDCIKRTDAYDRLSQTERAKVLASSKLKSYLNGLYRMAQAGVWMVATCFELQLLENESVQFLSSYERLKDAATSRWKSAIDPDVQGDLDAQLFNVNHLINLNKTSNLIGCEVTLDPITMRPLSISSSSFSIKNVSYVVPDGGGQVVYFQFARNIWEKMKPLGASKAALPLGPALGTELVSR